MSVHGDAPLMTNASAVIGKFGGDNWRVAIALSRVAKRSPLRFRAHRVGDQESWPAVAVDG